VQLDGAAQERDSVSDALAARGIASTPEVSCKSVNVRVEPARNGILVVLVSESGETLADRLVSDAKSAAAVIESWARPELYAMLLPEPSVPMRAAVDEGEVPPLVERPKTSRPSRPASILTAGLTSAVARDGSVWLGATAGGCVRFGSLCVGALLRASEDTRRSGDSYSFQTARTTVDLLLGIDVSREVGGYTLTGGGLAGLGFDRRRHDDVAGNNVEADGGSLRAGVHVGLSKPISTNWAIGADASVDTAVFAPSDSVDEGAMDLADQPGDFFRLDLQLRYEVR
jgi:hypothetical protein